MINLELNMALSRSSSTTYLRLCILSALGVFAISATAATADSSTIDDSELPQVELDKIVVTATRTPTKTSNVIAQTRVIDKEELQRYQGQTVTDILRISLVLTLFKVVAWAQPVIFICAALIVSKY